MSYSNNKILLENIPRLEDYRFELLEKNYQYLSSLKSFIYIFTTAILYFGTTKLWSWPGEFNIYFFCLLLLFALIFGLYSYIIFRHKGYLVREKDISYKSGYIYNQSTIIPYNRIQHTEISQGPLDRMFGLARLKIFTAGGSQSDLEIPGIRYEQAESLKFYIIGKTALDEEE